MAKPRQISDLGCEESFALAAARVVEVRADELLAHSDGFLDLGNIEALHDMRVATRRLRAAMEVFRVCFPKRRFRQTLREVESIADALGERRDRDVSVVSLLDFAGALDAGERAGVLLLADRMRSEQRSINASLSEQITPKRLDDLERDLRELVAAVRERADESEGAGG